MAWRRSAPIAGPLVRDEATEVPRRRTVPVSDAALRRLRLLVLAAAVAGGAWVYWGLDLSRHMSLDGVRALAEAHAPYGPLLLMAMIVAAILMPVPAMGILMIAVGGVLFDWVHAFAYGWIAALIGTTTTFVLVRHGARAYVERMLAGRSARLRALDLRLVRNGFWTVLVLRLAAGLAPFLNWGLGLTGVRMRHYVAGTGLGLIPGIAVAVFFAESIASRAPSSGEFSMVVLLRAVALLTFGAALLGGMSRRLETAAAAAQLRGSSVALAVNLAGFVVFFLVLGLAAGVTDGSTPHLLAGAGSLLAVAGAVIVRKSRRELGDAWSATPRASARAGLVTSGPYGLVRHPVYLGLSLLAAGNAAAFNNLPALGIVLVVLVPTFLWRAKVEETVLAVVFGDRFRVYQQRHKMIIPFLL